MWPGKGIKVLGLCIFACCIMQVSTQTHYDYDTRYNSVVTVEEAEEDFPDFEDLDEDDLLQDEEDSHDPEETTPATPENVPDYWRLNSTTGRPEWMDSENVPDYLVHRPEWMDPEDVPDHAVEVVVDYQEDVPSIHNLVNILLHPEEALRLYSNPVEDSPAEEDVLDDTLGAENSTTGNLTDSEAFSSEEAALLDIIQHPDPDQHNRSISTNLTVGYMSVENTTFYPNLDERTKLALNTTNKNTTKTVVDHVAGIHPLWYLIPTYLLIICYLGNKFLAIILMWTGIQTSWIACPSRCQMRQRRFNINPESTTWRPQERWTPQARYNQDKNTLSFSLEDPKKSQAAGTLFRSPAVDHGLNTLGNPYCDCTVGGDLPRLSQPICAACLQPPTTTVEEVKVNDTETAIKIKIKRKTNSEKVKEAAKVDHPYETIKYPTMEQATSTSTDQEFPTTSQAVADIHRAAPPPPHRAEPARIQDQLATADSIEVAETADPTPSTSASTSTSL